MISGVLLAPLSWFTQMELKYALVPEVCRTQTSFWLHVIGGVFFALAIGGLLAAVANFRAGHREQSPADSELEVFLGKLGLMMSPIFALLILGQEIASLIMSPCPG